MRLRSHAIVWFWIGTEPSMRQRTLATLANGLGLRTLRVSDENVRKAKTNLNIHISITDQNRLFKFRAHLHGRKATLR